jgi:hypothetical protein
MLGRSLMVQHYIEEIGQPDHQRLVSTSDVFTPTGRTKKGQVILLVDARIQQI